MCFGGCKYNMFVVVVVKRRNTASEAATTRASCGGNETSGRETDQHEIIHNQL